MRGASPSCSSRIPTASSTFTKPSAWSPNTTRWPCARQIGKQLSPEYRAAYFELVLYPIEACANLNELYVAAGLNHWYASQGRVATNEEADRVGELFARDAELTRQFHEDLAGGRWNHKMSQTHIGYTSWRDPPTNVMPAVSRIELPARPQLGVSVEGDTRAWPGAAGQAQLPELTPFSPSSRYLEVFDKGRGVLHFTVSAAKSWVHVSEAVGEITDQARVEVSVDWPAVSPGEYSVPIEISADGASVTVMARVSKPLVTPPNSGVYVEAGGDVAIEAAHFERAAASGGVRWVRIPALGRTQSAVTTFPSTVHTQTPGGDAPHLEYGVYLFHAGSVKVQVTAAPSLDFTGGRGLRYAISIDDEPPQTVNINAGESQGRWEQWVAEAANQQTTTHLVNTAGAHTLKLWMIDPGVVFERAGVLPGSYLGPPESSTSARS